MDAIEFAHQRAIECSRAEELHDKSSAALLWQLLILLCRQNGVCTSSSVLMSENKLYLISVY